MNIAIIIPVADDVRLIQCLESIDEDVEIVVAMNGASSEIKRIVSHRGLNYCEFPERNLGAALDQGIHAAKSERVLITNSDCTFNPGTIRKLCDGLNDSLLAKGRVLFRRQGFVSGVIARAREYTTDTISAFEPALAMRKSIVEDIGGYYYDRDIHWVEDSEFNNRVKRFRIPIKFVPDATINHPPLTAFYDLRNAFRYGIGKRIGVEKGIMHGVGSFFGNELDIVEKKGFWTALYMVFFNTSYILGWHAQMLFDVYHMRDNSPRPLAQTQ